MTARRLRPRHLSRSLTLVLLATIGALLGAMEATAVDAPATSVGPGAGRLEAGGTRGCGDLLMNADGTYENGYAWQYGGIVAPYFGAFAECFTTIGPVCGATFDFTAIGYQSGQTMDVYAWESAGAEPGAVACVTVGVDPGEVAFWPVLSRHVVELVGCPTTAELWIGYWGNWPNDMSGWFVGADTNGFGGCPRTNVAPGLGYPTGWQDVSVVWGPTQALGIGALFGDGTLEGACCYADGSCEIRTHSTCSGTFQGVGTFCDPNPCPRPGACCQPDGSCVLTVDDECSYEFLGEDFPCDPNPCSQPGACCFVDGSCLLRLESECSGTWFAGVCDPNPCPPPPNGACCLDDGGCVLLDAFECDDLDGIYSGDDTLCDPNPCPQIGACCFPDGTCLARYASSCTGVWQEGSCEPNPCPQPPDGACCQVDGSCLFLDGFACSDLGGNYLGDGMPCDPNPCPLPEVGACCLPDGGCEVLADFQCDDAGGTFQGDGASCDGLVCGVPCTPFLTDYQPALPGRGPNSGGTLILHANESLVFSSDDAYCGQSGLAQCTDAVTRTDEHFAPIVVHVIAAFPQNVSPRLSGVVFGIEYADCLRLEGWGACGNFELPTSGWPASGEGTAVTWASAQTTLLTEIYWFAAYVYSTDDTRLDLVPNPSHGAYFADDSIPSQLDPIVAFGSFGFGMDGVLPCPENLPVGACCFPDGSCEVLFDFDCVDASGVFQGDGTVCDPNPCSQPPIGGCCIGADCLYMSSFACDELGGSYLGEDIPCDPNPCIVPVIESSWGTIKERFRGN